MEGVTGENGSYRGGIKRKQTKKKKQEGKDGKKAESE